MAKGFTYILKCSDDSYYTGSTKNLELRLRQHQNGVGANHTKKRLPVTLMYFEAFSRIDEAFYREKQIQGWSRRKKHALIEGMPEKLHELAKCLNDSSHRNYSGFDSAQPPIFDSAQPPIFDSAQPPIFDSAQPPIFDSNSSLSGVEGNINSSNPDSDR